MAELSMDAGLAAAERLSGKWMSGGRMLDAASSYELNSSAVQGTVLTVADIGVDDALLVADAIGEAQVSWAETSVAGRIAIVRNLGQAIAAVREELVQLIVLESGKAARYAAYEVDFALVGLEAMCVASTSLHGSSVEDVASRRTITVTHRPVGPALLVTPWNFPLSLGLRKVVTALLAGCTFILKPSDRSPLTSVAIGEALIAAGLPAGVGAVIPTSDSITVVDALLGHPAIRKLSFTGSTAVGQALQRRASDELVRTSLELGGNAPFILGEHMPLETAASAIVAAKFGNSGQACTALNRLYVPRDRADELVGQLGTILDALVVGAPTSDATEIGPLITADAARRVAGLVTAAREAGATVHEYDGIVPDGGNYVTPAVISGLPTSSDLAQSEVFGPVLTVIPYDGIEDAIAQANATKYGLAAYVASNDVAELEFVVPRLRAGMVAVNSGSVSAASSPFGGVGWSGQGRENGSWGLSEFTDVVAVLR